MNPIDKFEFGLKEGLSKNNRGKYVYTPPKDATGPTCFNCQKEVGTHRIIEENGIYKTICLGCFDNEL